MRVPDLAARSDGLLGGLLPLPRTPARAGRLLSNLLLSAMFLVGVVTVVENWHLSDLKAYLAAAELLAAGGNPFEVQLWERGLPYHYHYSPWFAALFVPLTYLPLELVQVGWSIILIGASAMALVPLVRQFGTAVYPFAMLMAFLLANLVAEGNVQPLLLAALIWTLERRSGPIAVGVAASLKITPILFALVYASRGEWRGAFLAGAVAAVLVAPTLLFELPETATATGGTGLFTTAPVLWGVMLVAALAVTWWLARGRFGWLAAATATVLALPRLLIFDVTNLLAALPRARR